MQPTQPPQFIELQTSGPEQRRQVQKVGSLAFTIGGETHKLIAFADEGSLTRLFVPFYDLTNGSQTYRGGRYLEIDRTATGIYDLDFNHASNPYCVYNTQLRLSDPAEGKPPDGGHSSGRCCRPGEANGVARPPTTTASDDPRRDL